jgi:hypothetical protein
MNSLGRSLMILGAVIFAFGLLMTFHNRLPLRIGRLPGDLVWRTKGTTVYFPLATCLLLSVLFSLISLFFRRR